MKRIRQLFSQRSSQAGAGPSSAGPSSVGTAGRNLGPAPLVQTLGVSNSLFADASNFDQRFVEDYEKIETTVNALRTLGFKIVRSEEHTSEPSHLARSRMPSSA